jgi:hypothetical protein
MEQNPGFKNCTAAMMEQEALAVPYLSTGEASVPLAEISTVLDGLPKQAIAYAPWADGKPLPRVAFSIAHGLESIYLKYYVTEPALRAEHLNINDPVYEDSCVEVFIAFDDDASYYNLEFNCIGNCLGQYGDSKAGRAFLPAELLSQIRHQTQIRSSVAGQISWELTLCIPVRIFNRHPGMALSGRRVRANFYKCGDKLPDPHYLSWNNIVAARPEFHLIDFFREIAFLPHTINT